jgi:hypothetical protein
MLGKKWKLRFVVSSFFTVNGEGQCQKHVVKFTFSISACNPHGKRRGSMSKTRRKIDVAQFQRATLTVNGEGQCQKHIVK